MKTHNQINKNYLFKLKLKFILFLSLSFGTLITIAADLNIDGPSTICISSGNKNTGIFYSTGYSTAFLSSTWNMLSSNTYVVNSNRHSSNLEGDPNNNVATPFTSNFTKYKYRYYKFYSGDDAAQDLADDINDGKYDIPYITVEFNLEPWEMSKTVSIYLEANHVGNISSDINKNARKDITVYRVINIAAQPITIDNNNLVCDQGTNITAPTFANTNYNWSFSPSNAANIGSNWSGGAGFNVTNFNVTGQVKVMLNFSDNCGTSAYSESFINVQTKTAGPLVDNTGQSSINSIIPDANGNYQLRLSNYINGANYQWLTPSLYSPTNGFTNKITNTNQNSIIGKFPSNALQDYTGKVVKSGVCGVEEFPFTIKALVTPSIPTQIVSCDKTVPIFFNNPTFLSIYSSWVQSGPSGAYVQNINHQQVNLVATQNGVYNVCFSIQNLSQQPCTKVTVGKYPDRAQTPVSADWQAGTLSELPKDVASNLSATGNEGFEQIYFTDKSGKLWYYQFTNGINKWAPTQVDISSSPANLNVNPLTKSLVVHPIWPIVFYINQSGGLSRVSPFYGFPAQPIGGINQVSGKLTFSSDSYSGNGYFRNGNGSINIFNIWNNQSSLFANITSANEELYANGGYIYYVNSANNKIFRLSEANPNVSSQVVSKPDFPTVRTSTNIRVIGNNIYFLASNGRMVEANMTTDSWTYITTQQLTNAGPVPNFNGPFDINASTGVIYAKGSLSGLRGSVIPNQIAQIYKGVNSAWQIKLPGGSTFNLPLFYASNSLLFYYKHLYYISTTGKGIPNATDNNLNSVWNLYLNTECTPAIFRQEDNQSSSDILSSNVHISPNPFNGAFNVQLDQIGENKVELYNFLGVKMIESTSYGSYLGMATDGFPVGSYLAKVYQNGLLIATKKVIKE